MAKNILHKIIRAYFQGKKSYLAEIRCKNKRTLDIGCGFGSFLKFDTDNFIGIEINDTAIETGLKRGFKIIKSSTENIPFENNFFERIVALQVIEHLTPIEAFKMFCEAERLLKEEGEFIISTELDTNTFWNTFSHIKPYPPKSIYKLLRKDEDGLETFSKIKNLKAVEIYYSGRMFKNSFLNLLSQLTANYLSVGRKNYTLIMKKI